MPWEESQVAPPLWTEVADVRGPQGDKGDPGTNNLAVQPGPPADRTMLWIDTDDNYIPTDGAVLDFMSTVGSNPTVAALAGNAGNVGVDANQAMYAMVKPHRDVSATGLVWQCGVSSGNYDIGVFTATGALLWSKGPTVCPVAGVVTEVVPGIALTAGTPYFVGLALDNAIAKFRGVVSQSAEYARLLDGTATCLLKSASFPLVAGALGSTAYAHTPVVMVRGT